MHILLQRDYQSLGIGAALGAAFMAIIFIALALVVFELICHWLIYTKAGKPGWACLVPIYNIIVMLEIIGKPWWWLLLLLIPIVNIVIFIMMLNLLAKSFGQSVGFTLGLIFLRVIFLAILAFSKDMKYVGPAGLATAPPATPAQ